MDYYKAINKAIMEGETRDVVDLTREALAQLYPPEKILPGTGGFVSPSSFQRHAGPERLKPGEACLISLDFYAFHIGGNKNPVPSSS